MKEILEETYGVMVYQEQVMQISNRLAGYSLGEADLLRRAMGKKKLEEMAKQRARFLEGAKAKGHPQRKVEKIFDLMEKFAGYGFNKSHSAAYAYLAFVTAYLKTHYPLQFMSALLTSQAGNTDKVVKYINECREMGIRVLAPDVNSSGVRFHPGRNRGGIGNPFRLGRHQERRRRCRRIHRQSPRRRPLRIALRNSRSERVDLGAVNRRMIESFIKAGAMDSLEGTRAQLFAIIDSAMETGTRAWKDRESGQSGLFASIMEEQPAAEHPLPKVKDWTGQEKLTAEKETVGFYITGHPLDQYMDKVKELATHTTGQLEGLAKNTEVALLAGFSPASSAAAARKGSCGRPCRSRIWKAPPKRWFSPRNMSACFLFTLEEDKAVLVRALVLPEESGPPKLSVQEIVPLEVARVSLPALISIRVPVNGANPSDRAETLRCLFDKKPGDTEVRLRLEKSRDFSVILDIAAKVRPDKEFCAEIVRICGVEAMEILGS